MSRRNKNDLVKIKMDYMNHLSLEEICIKNGISYEGLRSQIRRKKWFHERELLEQVVVTRLKEIRIREVKEIVIKILEELHECCMKIYQVLLEKLKHSNDIEKLNELISMIVRLGNMIDKLLQIFIR